MAQAILGTYHLRGMTDNAGSPNAEIDTVKVEHYGDGTIRYTVEAVAALGFVTMSRQPVADETIIVNGVTFTFKDSGAVGAQSNIGADLGATLDNLVTVLNASADVDVDDATYTQTGDTRLFVTHDTPGAAGNTFALAAGTSGGTVSAATLTGGSAGTEYTWRPASTEEARLLKHILGLTDLFGAE